MRVLKVKAQKDYVFYPMHAVTIVTLLGRSRQKVSLGVVGN